MKNLGIRIALSAMFSAFALGAFAQLNIDNDYSTETIGENYQVVYSPEAKTWSVGGMAEDRIVLTKKISTGSGNYSEYYGADDEIAFSYGTGFEFLYNDKFIAQDTYGLKFYSIVYDNETQKFDRKNVSETGLKKIFDDAKIIKVSEFKDNVLCVRKNPFKPLKLLVINDTPEYFYKYHFEGKNFEAYNLAGLMVVNKIGKIKLVHPNEDFRALTIKVRPY